MIDINKKYTAIVINFKQMKKIYFLSTFLCVSFFAFSQKAIVETRSANVLQTMFANTETSYKSVSPTVIFGEDFESETIEKGKMPEGWTIFDLDGKTPQSNVAGIKCWGVFKLNSGRRLALSTSYYKPAGKADDWTFTPAITLPAPQTGKKIVVDYFEVALDPGYPDSYELRVMTEVPTEANINSSDTLRPLTAGKNGELTSVDLTKYAGQTIYLGWRNNSNDQYVLGIDDVKVMEVDDYIDLAIENIILNSTFEEMNKETKLKLIVRNTGTKAIESFEYACSINGADFLTPQKITTNLNRLDIYTTNVDLTFDKEEINTIKIKITKVNDKEGDDNDANDTIETEITIYDPSKCKVGKELLTETFTSAYCPPCASWNPIFDEWSKDKNEKVNFIKYQMYFPGKDKYFIEQCKERADYYGGVTSVPSQYAQGKIASTSSGGNWSANYLNDVFNSETAKKSFLSIEATPIYSGKTVTLPIEIESTISTRELKVYVAICEKTTKKNTGNNGEKEFHNVLMQMLPNTQGTAHSFKKDKKFTVTLTKDMSGTNVEEISDLVAIVFVQDDKGKEVIQSETFKIETKTSVADKNLNGNIKIYPSPANNNLNVNIELKNRENVIINIISSQGKIISTYKENNTYIDKTIDVSNLENGLYFLEVKTNNRKTIEKFIVNHNN